MQELENKYTLGWVSFVHINAPSGSHTTTTMIVVMLMMMMNSDDDDDGEGGKK